MLFAERIQQISEPETIAMARKARELKAQGKDVINLSLGEPDFNTPPPIKEAARKAIDENFSHYTHVSGYLELRKAIAGKFKRDNELHYSPEQIVVSTGAKQCIANAMLCLVNPGDEVLVPSPYWVTYVEQVKLAGGKPVMIPGSAKNNFKVTAEQIGNAVTPKTRLLVFSSPCNPTGSVYTKEELTSIAEVILSHQNIFVISDEIYEYINYLGKHFSIARVPGMAEKTVVVNGASKSFAMTGWRVGFMGAPLEIAKACDKLQGQFTSATSSISQKAVHCAMELNSSVTQSMCETFRKRRDLVFRLLQEIPGIKTNLPDGAFYFFPDVSVYLGKKGLGNSTDLCMHLLEKALVAVVPGIAFGNDNHIRISYAASEVNLKEGMKRIKKALTELS